MAKQESMNSPDSARRLFVSDVSDQGTDVVLRGPSKRYVRDVLRMGRGDSLVLFDGSGMEYLSTIIEATTRNVTVRIQDKRPGTCESPLRVLIGIGLLKANKMDLVIQKASELGVQEIIPVAVRRAVPSLASDRAEQRRERWLKIAREASRQCGRTTVPEVRPVLPFEALLERGREADLSLLFTTAATRPLGALEQERAALPGQVMVLVGPEGGFTPEEEQAAQERGFLRVGLGPRILRAETAAITAMGLVQYTFGDLGGSHGDVLPTDP